MSDLAKETPAVRVRRMEELFDALVGMRRVDPDVLRHSAEAGEMLRILTEYLDSGLWLADYEADERGELPDGLKRGILSQDALYNLVCDAERELTEGSEP